MRKVEMFREAVIMKRSKMKEREGEEKREGAMCHHRHAK
jgi:hypothetical protein